MKARFIDWVYESDKNILHIWHPSHVMLGEPNILGEFIKELTQVIKSCPIHPFLLVNFSNLEIDVSITDDFGRAIKAYRPYVIEIFRYGVPKNPKGIYTAAAVKMGNALNSVTITFYPGEAEARQAIADYKPAEQNTSNKPRKKGSSELSSDLPFDW